MKRIMKGLAIITCMILILIGYSIYESNYSKEAVIGKQNITKVKGIKIGMDTTDVLNIMGRPDERRVFKRDIHYDYEVPPGSSFQCTIVFNQYGNVIYISYIPD